MASKIISVDEGSPAARAGLAAGETLLQIDGTAIRDVLDYKFYSYDARLTLKVLEQDGETVREVRVRKREGEPLGLNFEHYLICLLYTSGRGAESCRKGKLTVL